jgi:hypothetical protein
MERGRPAVSRGVPSSSPDVFVLPRSPRGGSACVWTLAAESTDAPIGSQSLVLTEVQQIKTVGPNR